MSGQRDFLMRHVNIVTIILLLGLSGVGFIVMNKTAESNAITVDVAKYQSQKESKIALEMRLLTLEMKNMRKDLEKIRERVESKKFQRNFNNK